MSKEKLVYIASGMAYSRITLKDVVNSPEIQHRLRELYKPLRGYASHDFGMLFNGWAEKRVGEVLTQQYADILKEIHADSGGLQVITRGVNLTNQIKEDVYHTQAKYSDVAMCFDEIPVKTVGNSSSRNDTSNRFYCPSELEAKARETGRNVARQIEIFIEEKTKAKPCLIIQGNDYDSYMRWTEYCLEEIPKDHHDYICGVAMGGAALGTGFLEDIKRAVFFRQLPINTKEKYLHILGVGSVKRLIPYLTFTQSGYYDESTVISYDSTTHTSGVDMGQYYSLKDSGIISFSRPFTNMYQQINDEITANVPGYDFNAHQLHHALNSNTTTYTKDISDFVYLRNAFLVSSIKNFMKVVESVQKDKETLIIRADDIKGGGGALRALYNIKNKSDYEYWLTQYGNRIPSSPVYPEKTVVSLEDFY